MIIHPEHPDVLTEWRPGAWFLEQAWRREAGMSERREPELLGKSIEELRQSEWSAEFEALMRNRLVMGAFRYGLLGALGKPAWDRVGSIRERLAAYERDGNLEHLADVANMALLEFVEGRHPHRHFSAGDGVIHAGVAGARNHE